MADSSFLVEGLLKRKELLEKELIATPTLALYEVANSIWKHERVLRDIGAGSEYLSVLYSLVDSGAITLVDPSEELAGESYFLALKHGTSVYDTTFISIALELGVELETFDAGQRSIFKAEQKSGSAKRPRKP